MNKRILLIPLVGLLAAGLYGCQNTPQNTMPPLASANAQSGSPGLSMPAAAKVQPAVAPTLARQPSAGTLPVAKPVAASSATPQTGTSRSTGIGATQPLSGNATSGSGTSLSSSYQLAPVKPKGPGAPLTLARGTVIPVIPPSDIVLAQLKAGSHILLEVADTGVPISSGADPALMPGTQVRLTVVRKDAYRVECRADAFIDGSGKSTPLTGAISTLSGQIPEWMIREEHADEQWRSEQTAKDAEEAGLSRAELAEKAGNRGTMGVVLPWILGGKMGAIGNTAMVAVGAHLVNKYNKAEAITAEQNRKRILVQRILDREAILRDRAEERALKAALGELRGDIAQGSVLGILLTDDLYYRTDRPDVPGFPDIDLSNITRR